MTDAVSVDWREFDRLKVELDTVARKALPHAARNAMNRSAFETRTAWIGATREAFVVRNTFTERSIRVDKAKGTDVDSMQAVVGSTADYMRRREEGETKTPKGGKHVPVPTVAVARGGTLKSPVRRPNRMAAITLTNRQGASRAQRNAIAIRKAKGAGGSKFAYLETDKGGGIFKVTGGKRKSTIRMVWDLRRASISVKPMPTLEPTLKRLEPRYVAIHEGALVEQLKRYNVLGY